MCRSENVAEPRGEMNGRRKRCYLWSWEAHMLKINLHKMTYWKLLGRLLLINASFFRRPYRLFESKT